jgi:alcohol dehydrogenase (cytochrome c)
VNRVLGCIVAALALGAHHIGAQVSAERLLTAERDSGSWLTYSGDYQSHRYSSLKQITPANVGFLRPVWMHQVENTEVGSETTPIVADGIMYITESLSAVTALDVRTGRQLWHYAPPMPRVLRAIGFPPVNRGVAILDSTVYVGTLAAHLVALDARSGAVRWDVAIADNAAGYAFTAAPLAIKDRVLIGVSGGEAGIRGFLDAYDARTGRRLWRFNTIPAPGERGSETWSGDAWKTGGGPTWVTGSYDPALNLVYWGVGNPGADWNGDKRPGDNLYTNSLVALDADTGALRWYFQFTPHDTHDWDANQVPVLVDLLVAGRPRKLVITANRNGFYYVLDRVTGEFLRGVPFAHQTWARGLDARGRPIVIPGTEPSEGGTLVYPSLQGATSWFSPTFSPLTGLFYVAVREMGAVFYKREATYTPGAPYIGGGEHAIENDSASGAIRALDPVTGVQRWEFPLHSPPWAGLLSTASGLLFGGSNEGNVFALSARSGQALWQFQTGGPISAAPISFLIDGRQYIEVAARNVIIVFGLTSPSGT